jgi:hypothetical protein
MISINENSNKFQNIWANTQATLVCFELIVIICVIVVFLFVIFLVYDLLLFIFM